MAPLSKDPEWVSRIPSFAGRKLMVIATASLFLVWFLFLFGPSPSKVATIVELPDVPKISIDLHPNRLAPSPYNASKVAMLMEDRSIPHLAPLLLHMISVVPPDWRFVFLGSNDSIAFVNQSLPVQAHERNGKLDFMRIPPGTLTKGQEEVSVTMTSPWFWKMLGGKSSWDYRDPYLDEVVIGPDGKARRRDQVEWMLVFQTDSIMCANSRVSLNDWLQYDWVGAPWSIEDRYGGNGGLSLRRLSAILKVLEFQERTPESELEDLWLIHRIGNLPGAKMANGTVESGLSVEQVWNDEPMGYHTGWGGQRLPDEVWGTKAHRERIWEYCPEIKLILGMRLEREGCPDGPGYEEMKRSLEGREVDPEVEVLKRVKAW